MSAPRKPNRGSLENPVVGETYISDSGAEVTLVPLRPAPPAPGTRVQYKPRPTEVRSIDKGTVISANDYHIEIAWDSGIVSHMPLHLPHCRILNEEAP